jgi:hypothetical protein
MLLGDRYSIRALHPDLAGFEQNGRWQGLIQVLKRSL